MCEQDSEIKEEQLLAAGEGSVAEEEDNGLYEHFRVVADRGQQLVRIDKFLLDHLADTSRNRLQQAARSGFLYVNGSPVKSNYRVKPFDVVTLLLDRPRYENLIEPENIPISLIRPLASALRSQ
jgi:23S rRNA pseudouridine1911/1915/1917 synthase